MELSQLRAFLGVVDSGGFSAAGSSLNISQSAVSLRIKALEQEFGALLFDRTQKQPFLTDAGRSVLPVARQIVALSQALPSCIGEPISGSLIIGAVPTALISILPNAIAKIRELHPRISLTVESGGSALLAAKISAQELDVAILTKPSADIPNTRIHKIVEENCYWVMPKSMQGTPIADILKSEPFIWFNRRSWAGEMIEKYVMHLGLPLRTVMEISSLEAVVAMVSCGVGVSIVPLNAASRSMPESVTAELIDQNILTRTLILAEPGAAPKNMISQPLIKALREEAQIRMPRGRLGASSPSMP